MTAWVRRKISHIPDEVKKIWTLNSSPESLVELRRRKASKAFGTSVRKDTRPESTIGSPEIQELDGGFFEKFGSLLRENQEDGEATDPGALNGGGGGGGDGSGDGDSGAVEIPTSVLDSDSEPEDSADQTELITDAMGWNVDELYSEVLYEIVHVVGCDFAEDASKRDELFTYLQEAFKLDADKHADLLARAQAKEAPKILLNVEVIDAKDLRSKDANGLSDPFCTLFLSSGVTHRFNTSVKPETLSPVWEEHFSLPVENVSDDVMHIEVWDFDPAETIRDKMSKITATKGIRGLRRLMKEIAVTASTGKHDNELIGSAQLSLKGIPASGQAYWLSLEKKPKNKAQGEVRVRLSFSAQKNAQAAQQEHRHLLRLLLVHELEEKKVEAYRWQGAMPAPAQTVLSQHAMQCNLSSADIALARWAEYAAVHVDHPLSFTVFPPLLETLVRHLRMGQIRDEEARLFWEAARKLLPSCMNAVRKIHKLTPNDRNTITQLTAVLTVLSQLGSLQPPEGTNLFPASVYGWLETASPTDGAPNCDIRATLEEAVKQRALDWLAHAQDGAAANDSSDEAQLSRLVRVAQLVRSDLQRAIEFHDSVFLQHFNFPYSRTLFLIYQDSVSQLVEPVVTDVCGRLKPLRFSDSPGEADIDNDPLTMGTKLFEVYLIMQRLNTLGAGLCAAEEARQLRVANFHAWFARGVAQWLDIALYKAMQRVTKAVDIDELSAVDESVKYSSSAIDTLAIFYQIKIFWKQLDWPDVEGSYAFVAKIIDDICKCSVHYADSMSKKVEGMGESESVYQKKFEVTNEWCVAINNIDYVRLYIEPFVEELGMEEVLTALGNFGSAASASHCRQTLLAVVSNAVDVVGNKIVELLETVARKMAPAVKRFLLEGAELAGHENGHLDRLMKYLDDNLRTLHAELNADNFDRILTIVWEDLARVMNEIIDSNLEKRRPPSFYSHLRDALAVLVGFFEQGGAPGAAGGGGGGALDSARRRLELHGAETADLVHAYHLERANEQRRLTTAPLGLVTVRAVLLDGALRVQIMNARSIKPTDANGSCDPYVKIHLLPEEKFVSVALPKTRTHKKNLFPLFDETFTIPLTPEQRDTKDALILFSVKDQDFLTNEFIAEAFLPFSDIPRHDDTVGLEQLEQVHLKLSRPARSDSESLSALEHRQGDKLAQNFVKRLKTKFTVPH